jgi:hypothetical protein
MGKLSVAAEREDFHRVWNFVVPLHELANNSPVKSIPPLAKNYYIKHTRPKKRRNQA